MHFWGRGRFFLLVVAAFFLFTACSGNATTADVAFAYSQQMRLSDFSDRIAGAPAFNRSFGSSNNSAARGQNKSTAHGQGIAAQSPATGIVQMYRELPDPAQAVKREIPLPGGSDHTESVDSKSADFAGTDSKPARDYEFKGSEAVDCREEKCVALTFDDGPAPTTTPKLLDILASEGVPATFFVLGTQVQKYPEIVERAANQGHEIGSHTWEHARLTLLPSKAVTKDLDKTNRMIKKAIGTAPMLLRPPYGSTNKTVAKVAKQTGLAVILWDVDSRDWEHRNPKKTVKEAKAARDGSIILLHDIHDATVAAMPDVITVLRKQGFTFVTVSELVSDAKPGESYFRASP